MKPIEVTGITRVKRMEWQSSCDIPEIRTELIETVIYSNASCLKLHEIERTERIDRKAQDEWGTLSFSVFVHI